MNINSERYMKSITDVNKNTFLNRWHKKKWDTFYHKYQKEFIEYNKYWCEMYDKCSYNEWDKIRNEVEKQNPTNIHKIEYFFVQIPAKLEGWLCCGFKLRYDKNIKQWTWIENYHMMDKVCRYETWKNVHINLWDKIRFKLITGYDFE